MTTPRPTLLGATCLALILASSPSWADKKNNEHGQNGKPNQQMNTQHSQQGTKQAHGKSSQEHNNYSDDDFQRRYQDDEDDIRNIFERNSGHYGQVEALPPGIRKNLARGKPLPPGIAKQLDPRFASQLPRYDGYEWRQVGTDAALVNVTTGVVREVLNDVLR